MWVVIATPVFDEWLALLPAAAKDEVLAKLNLLRSQGPRLKRPHADTLKGSKFHNMKELRAQSGDHVLRVAFAFDPKRRAIVLIGGDKAGVNQRQFYRSLIAKADALYQKYLDEVT